MLRLPRHPAVWLAALLVWFGVLWFCSTIEGSGEPPPLPHFDKVLHFTYFFGGGILAAGWLHALKPDWKRIVPVAVTLLAVLAFIDEWHQCYTPGRSGADPWDWLADLLGSYCGTRAFMALRQRISR
jgi:VanZ family protein